MVATSLPNTELNKPLVQIDSLDVDFDRHRVLRGINMSISRGQTVAIIGESGCGKTVLLKTMIGLLSPSRGEVYFDGKNLAAMPEKELTQQRIRFGFLFQQAALFDSMTIAQNIAFPMRQHTQKTGEEIQRIIAARLAEVGLPENVLGKKPAELSGGMRKRVGLARALALEPEIILYDEPTTGLDPIRADVINALILKLHRQLHGTSIAVTHDMSSAFKIADRIVMLHEGTLIADGSPDDIRNSTNPIVRRFVLGEADERELAALE